MGRIKVTLWPGVKSPFDVDIGVLKFSTFSERAAGTESTVPVNVSWPVFPRRFTELNRTAARFLDLRCGAVRCGF